MKYKNRHQHIIFVASTKIVHTIVHVRFDLASLLNLCRGKNYTVLLKQQESCTATVKLLINAALAPV